MPRLFAASLILLLSLVPLGCQPSEAPGDSEDAAVSEEAQAANESLTQQFLFDGGMNALLPCEPEEGENASEDDELRAATCQGVYVHVTALWLKGPSPEELDLEEDSTAVLNSARAALERRGATDITSETTETEVDGLPAVHTTLEGVVEEQALTVEATVVAGEKGGWGLQLLYNSDSEPAQAQVERIFDSLHVEPDLSPDEEEEG